MNKEKFLQKTIIVWLGALVCCALWGSAFPCIKLGYAWLLHEGGSIGASALVSLALVCIGIYICNK